MQSSANVGHAKITGKNEEVVAAGLSGANRFLAALRCKSVDRPPMWLMRQAGRCLPEYRKLREQFTFRELINHPDLAAEVTLQPVRRFGFDAAILFSDILVVPEALGQPFYFNDKGGVRMDFPIRTQADINRLDVDAIADKLASVATTLRLIRRGLDDRTALIGFCGSPWTLANFMLEGGSSKNPTKALDMFREQPELYQRLAWKLTRAVTEFLRLQIEAGVDAVQIFDSLGGILPDEEFEAASAFWMRSIVEHTADGVPVIVFSKGARNFGALARTGAHCYGVDHDIEITKAAAQLPAHAAIQGNFNPELLSKSIPEQVEAAAVRLLDSMSRRNGYIFNLGHGVPPDAKMENLEALAATVKNYHRTGLSYVI
jgi:uroporphyrinogen decarboxylase